MRVGIDYSVTAPAIYVERDDGTEKWYLMIDVLRLVCDTDQIQITRTGKYDSKIQRAIAIAEWAVNILTLEGVKKANLESFSMGSNTGLSFDIGAHTGILFERLYRAGIEVNFIPPTTAKLSFTGKGGAKKDVMCDEFFKRRGWRFSDVLKTKPNESPENDLVDAYAIAHCDTVLDEKSARKMFM